MRILVIAATHREIAGLHVNQNVETLVTGVGIPATLYNLQKSIGQQPPGLVIQTGIAGTFSHDRGLGEVVVVAKDCFADIGIEEKERFTSIFHAGFADKDAFPFLDGWLPNNHDWVEKSRLNAVKGITVNKVSDSLLQKRQLIEQFLPDVESMEGAALHYVCLQEKVPFLQIRSISNMIGERDKTKWKINEALASLSVELNRIVADAANELLV